MKSALRLVIFSTLLGLHSQADVPLTAHWPFAQNLEDVSGNGLDGFSHSNIFTAAGTVLLKDALITIPDAPFIRIAPGFTFTCRIKLNQLPASDIEWTTLFMKGDYANGEYLLRVNSRVEGRHFGFFMNTGPWEPRVNSLKPVETNIWYDIAGGWDGQSLWLSVNNATTRVSRTGTRLQQQTYAPLVLGAFDGECDDLTLASLRKTPAGVANWTFEKTLEDRAAAPHTLTPDKAVYAPVPGGFALDAATTSYTTPSVPDLQLAPGLRIDCSVLFRELPTGITTLVSKHAEYMLRVDPKKEGNRLSFFVFLNGWEPRVQTDFAIQTGVWYRISAQWNGTAAILDVNGDRNTVMRTGKCVAGDAPLSIGRFNGLLDNLRIENPKLPQLTLLRSTTESVLLQAGRSERIRAVVTNPGQFPASGTITLEVPHDTLTVETAATHTISQLAAGSQQTVEWSVKSPRPQRVHAYIQIQPEKCLPTRNHHALAFFDVTEDERTGPLWQPPRSEPGKTYYIDSKQGDNARSGQAEEEAWRDFTPINTRALQPGDALLLRRGSTFTQELIVEAQGRSNAWIRIGAYGEGPRPIIRRTGDIAERCMQIRSPAYFHLSSVVVCYAGKGIECLFSGDGPRQDILIEDVIAHHIEGLYRFNAHGIPEWTDRHGAPGGGNSSAGIYLNQGNARNVLIRNCEMFHCSWGFLVGGENMILDRIFCHDNYVHNTSPHPAMTGVYRSYLQNSIFDASGWHAYAGTMGIMLVDPVGFIVRNCHFLNMADSGSHDSGGIDFEARGEGCVVDQCTFRNNAGAAIEVLGLQSPQPRNVAITRSRFIQNNVAHKLGPAEIFIWGRSPDPNVCCSSGSIYQNGYVLNPGVVFFTNEAPALTQWTVYSNQAFQTAAELDRKMPLNNPPEVDAGPEQWIDRPALTLRGLVHDDRRTKSKLKIRWEVLEGPGDVAFESPEKAETLATFAGQGDYLLRLVADDGHLWRSSMTTVHVLPPQTEVVNTYDFNQPLNKQGWSEYNLGTQDKEWKSPIKNRGCVSRPVNMVGGGNYIVAIENTTNAFLLSADDLNVDFSAFNQIVIAVQNHTPLRKLNVRWTTALAKDWDSCPRATVDVQPLATQSTRYTVTLPAEMIAQKRLKQLRIDLTDGTPNTGTFRIDYIYFAKGPN